jgi:IS30 family transposase
MGAIYNHLRYEDRVKIEHWHAQGQSIRFMARELRRSPNTISYELENLKVSGAYAAKKASVKAYQKRYYARTTTNRVARDKRLRSYVDAGLALGWSPGEIAGSSTCPVSKRTIYRYVKLYALSHKLYFKGKPKRRKSMYRKSLIGERKWIEERILRDEIGHYELDFIVSSHSSAVLLVAVDTLSKRTKIELLPNRTRKELSKGLRVMFDGVAVKTILTDNDIAFTYWQYFEELLGAPFYFTHPYHSWEKGLVENTNKWIRHFIPKKTDLQTVTKETIAQVLTYLNDRPRQVLGYRTANEVYLESLTIHVKCPT